MSAETSLPKSAVSAPFIEVACTHNNPSLAWGAIKMLVWREWVRFFRQRNRVIGALGQPILFWLLFGTGMHGAFRADAGQDFMSYYLPGTITLIVLFTAIFTTISVIEDRREGFMQCVFVAPVPRWTIVAGKVIGGGAIAWMQGLLFLILALCIGSITLSWQLLPLLVLLGLAALAMTALGLFFAWPMESTQGFHAIMNLVLMPMWLLSGAFFPVPLLVTGGSVGQFIMHWTMRLNPVTYIIGGMRHLLTSESSLASSEYWLPTAFHCWCVSFLLFIATFTAAWWMVVRGGKANLT